MKGACWIPVFLFVAGNAFGQATGDYRTRQSGNWNSVGISGTWERFNGSTWVTTGFTQPSSSNAGIITIQSGHAVTITAGISIDQAIIESGGTLTINNNITLTVANGSGIDLTVNGTLTNNGTLTLSSSELINNGTLTHNSRFNINGTAVFTNNGTFDANLSISTSVTGTFNNAGTLFNNDVNQFAFNSGSAYNHNFTTTSGTIPLASWDANSNCNITDYTTNAAPPGNLSGQTFGNFIWNTPDLTQSIDLNGGITSVTNNLSISVPSGVILDLSQNQSYDLIVGGDFITGGLGSVNMPGTLHFTASAGTGNLVNNGLLNLGSNSVLFFEGFFHNIGGSSPILANDINLINGSSVSVEGLVSISGILTLDVFCTFDADGSTDIGGFTLLSSNDSPTADASIAPIPPDAIFTGNVTVQRYMAIEGANNGRIYRYISSPVTNAAVADFQNEIPVTGSFTGASSCSGCVSANQSMWSYNEAITTGTLNDGYVDFPNTANTETFQPGVGYIFFVRGDLLGLDAAWDLTGPINQGDVVFDVSFTSSSNDANDGWNLVGNPYPSAIDWDAAEWTKSGLNGTIYMRDNGNGGQVATYTTGSGGVNGGSNIIAMGQGFWVKADNSATPELIAAESVKVSGTPTEFFRKTPPKDLLKVALTNNIKRDEMLIHFREGASEGYDKGDALKLKNSSVFNLASLADEKLMAINSLPPIGCARSIDLSLSEVTPGDYSLEFSELESFNAAITSIVLKDNFLDSMLDVNMESKSYEFSITNAPESYGNGRFSLIFTEVNPEIALTEVQEVCVDSEASITISDSQPPILYTILADEETIVPESQGNGRVLTLNIPKDKLSLGQNNFVLRSYVSGCNAETVDKEFIVKVIEPPVAKVESMGSHCNEGSVTLEASGAGEYGTYNWYLKENSMQPVEGEHASIFVTPVLNKPETYFVSALNSIGCEGPRVPVMANIIRYDPVVISTELNGLLHSSYEEGNQWFFNGEKVPGATGSSFIPHVSGEYKVEVSLDGGCTTTCSLSFNIEQFTEAEQNLNDGITLYPNPVESMLILKAPSDMKIKGSAIFNTMGQQIGKVAFTQGDGAVEGKYDMALTPPGIYFVNVTLESGKVVQLSVYKK